MAGGLMCCFVSYFWVLFGLILVAAVVLFAFMAVKKMKRLAPVGGALLALCGMLFGVYQYLEPKCLPVELVITDEISQNGLQGFHDLQIKATNDGKAIARNCRMEIEHRDAGEGEYKYLGSALLQPENISPDVKTYFWLARSRSYNDKPWEVWIITEGVKNLVEGGQNLPYPSTFEGPGEHELRLTIICANAKSSPSEFKLTIHEETNRAPDLEPLH
jgi:hypothetical protein